MSVKSKTLLKVQQIREEITADQDFKKDFGGATGEKTMLKLDHGNDAVVLGDGTDITVHIAGTMQAPIAMGTSKITGMGDPTDAQDAATKKYVDDQIAPLDLDIVADNGGAGIDIDFATETLDIAGGDGITTSAANNQVDIALDAQLTTVTSIANSSLVIGGGASNSGIDFSGNSAQEISFAAGTGQDQMHLKDGALEPDQDSDLDLGSSAKRFKDAYVDTVTITADADIMGNIELGHASDTTLSRVSAGEVSIEGNIIYRENGIDVDVADGGTGRSSLANGEVVIGAGAGALNTRPFGIANENVVRIDAAAHAPAQGDYAKLTANGIEGKSPEEVMGDLNGQNNSPFSFGDERVTNVATPINDSDATNKEYVDGLVQGISAKKAVRVRTSDSNGDIMSEPASYKAKQASLNFGGIDIIGGVNGYDIANRSFIVKTSGGSVVNGILPSSKTDGVLVRRGDRVLVMSEASAHRAAHGIYDVAHPGADAGQDAGFEIGFGAGLPQDSDYILFRKLEGSTEAFRIAFQSANVASQPTTFGALGATIGGERVVSVALSVGGAARSANDLAADIRTLLGSINTSGDFTGWSVGGAGNIVQFEKKSSQEIADDLFLEEHVKSGGPQIDLKAYAPAGGLPYLLVRSEDSDAVGDDKDGEFELGGGSFVFVREGSTFKDTGFVCQTDANLAANQTLDEGARLEFVQFSSAGTVTASNGVIRNVNNLEMNIASLTADNVALATTDRLAYMDDADAGDATKSVTLEALLNGVAGDGITREGAALDLDINDLAAATAIGHGDLLAFHDLDNTAGTKKTTTLELATLLADSTDFDVEASSSKISIKDNAITLDYLQDGSQGQILSYGAGGAPTRLNKGAEHTVLVAGATDPAYALLVDDNIANGAAIATSKLAADTISGVALGGSLADLSAGTGLEFTTANDYDGSAAKTIRMAVGGIDQSSLNSIECYHISSAVGAVNEIANGDFVFGQGSSVASLDDLVANVQAADIQSLNRSMCVQVYLNGMLLQPDQTGDHSTTFTLGAADYKFILDGSDIKLRFNGNLIEGGDLVRITGMAFS